MPFYLERTIRDCPICESHANLHSLTDSFGVAVDCNRCGNFQLEHSSIDDWNAKPPDKQNGP